MSHVKETDARVKRQSRRLGRPPSCTPAKEREIICACVKGLVVDGKMPSDRALGRQVGLSERTARGMRLRVGLNRRITNAWVKEREHKQTALPREQALCWTPYAGLWLLVPLIVRTTFWNAVQQLRWMVKTRVAASSWALTVLIWAVLGFRRFMHLDDFRHEADLGLALFVGRTRLLADSTMWRLVHSLKRASAEEFYQQTAAGGVPLDVPAGAEWLSMDEHVVGFFTKLKPRPLGKDRVPTRGRAYPAIRLYAPFHLHMGRYMGLVVTKAGSH